MNHYPFFPGGQPPWPTPTKSVLIGDRAFQTACYAQFVARDELKWAVPMDWDDFKNLWVGRFGSVYKSSGATGAEAVEKRLHARRTHLKRGPAASRAPHGGAYSRAAT